MNQFSDKRFSGGGVAAAQHFVHELVLAFIKKGQDDNTTTAIDGVARHCRVSRADVRKYWHASRQPKDIRYSLWQRFRSGYARYLSEQLGNLETELRRVEAMDHLDAGAVGDLAHEAEALIARIKQTLNTKE